MATWRDGASYAPIERPHAFAAPLADALPMADPTPETTPGPVPPPQRLVAPDWSAIRLENVVPRLSQPRDARQPFETTSSLMTGDEWAAPAPATPPTQAIQLSTAPVSSAPEPPNFPPPTSPPVLPGQLNNPAVPPSGYGLTKKENQTRYTIIAVLVAGVLLGPMKVVAFVVSGVMTNGLPQPYPKMFWPLLGAGFIELWIYLDYLPAEYSLLTTLFALFSMGYFLVTKPTGPGPQGWT